jgi:hypothetical protein
MIAEELAVTYPKIFWRVVDLHGAKLARNIDRMLSHRSAQKNNFKRFS